jgi:hypothetical protein
MTSIRGPQAEIAELAERKVISIGIGINTGPVVFGSVCVKDRMDFTSIGDTVNLAAYRKQKWDLAEKAFAAMKSEFKDETSEVFLRRIALFRRNPPGDGWDGVFNLTVK